ncbi:MAG: hypothetical protein ABI151_15095 [Chitinophagaceae bacterium]
MAINLLESLQSNLGYAPITKIDPNTQKIKSDELPTAGRNLAQAAIPAVLLALYKYGNTEQGSNEILRGNTSTDWLTEFLAERKEDAIGRVSSYSGESKEVTDEAMKKIAAESVRLIRQEIPENSTFETVKTFVNEQRNNILPFLPAELQIGDLVNDTTIDDRTNKMEGPMSNGMHFFEKLFSGSTTEKNEKTIEED